MLNYLWAFMILAGVLWAAFHGTMNILTQGLLDAAKDAVSLCITMLGVISMWTGILKIGQKSGLMEQLSEKMAPILRFLFPNIPEEHPARASIAANMIANILGLGWAATPAGLKAMKELAKLEEERGNTGYLEGEKQRNRSENDFQERHRELFPERRASNEMCTFLIINISSLQLIPVNMIAYRSQYDSTNPALIVGPAIAATAVSTAAAVVFCRVMDRKRRV